METKTVSGHFPPTSFLGETEKHCRGNNPHPHPSQLLTVSDRRTTEIQTFFFFFLIERQEEIVAELSAVLLRAAHLHSFYKRTET